MYRYYCFSCGRFWYTPEKMEVTKNQCPFCFDYWFGDNVVTDKPMDLFPKELVKFVCGHFIETDTPGDLTGCPFCKSLPIEIKGTEKTLENWQKSKLRVLGIIGDYK